MPFRAPFFSFKERICRISFWEVIIMLLLNSGLQCMLIIVCELEIFKFLGICYFIIAFWIMIATCVKRCQDLNKSGWMTIFIFIPFANIFFLFYLGFFSGTVGTNKFGEAPAGDQEIYILSKQERLIVNKYQQKVNIGIGLGTIIVLFSIASVENIILPVALVFSVIGSLLFIFGSFYYAKVKGYSPILGLLGFLFLPGIVIMAFLPAKIS